MITRCNLPDEIILPCGARLKPVIGGHLEQKPFIKEVDVTKNGWAEHFIHRGPNFSDMEENAIVREAKKQGLKFRHVAVLGRNLRGKLDLHGRKYEPTRWVFVEVKP